MDDQVRYERAFVVPTAHPSLEEYLQAIAFLREEGGPVIQARLAARLKKTPAAVSEVIIRLEADGYLTRDGRQIELTETGEKVATAVIRRHRLAERLLVDVVGLSWSAAHLEAGRYEHVLSEEVEARIVALLGDPATCPHGNPIPGSHNPALARTALAPLDAFGPGEQVRLERLPENVEDDLLTLQYFEQAGFLPGVVATVREHHSDGTMLLELRESTVALGPALSSSVLVMRVTEDAVATASR